MEETKYISLRERSLSEKATPCMILMIGSPGKSKTIETVKRSAVARGWQGQRLVVKGQIGRPQRIFRTVKLLCIYPILMVDTCHKFVQTHRMYSTKGEP